MDKQILQIKMLGSFSMTIGGTPLLFTKSRNSKTTSLLQYLLLNCGKSIPKDKLIDVVYGSEEIENPVKALQVLMTRLRQGLLDAGLPNQEYICCSDGMYNWNKKIPCEIDIIEFEKAVQEANRPGQTPERKIELYTKAIELYEGDFIPNLTGNDWAVVMSAYYLNLYMQCFEKVWKLLREKGDYLTMLKLCSKGIGVNPSEEKLHIINIRCLIENHCLKDALMAYNSTTEMLRNEWFTDPSKELQELYTEIADKLKDERLPINKIRDELIEEPNKNGAYYCSRMSFADSYRLVSRIMERSGQSAYLMLCNLTDSNGGKPDKDMRLTYAANCLTEAMRNSLRRGDMYTRYSVTQFLVLLVGTNMENCMPISKRIAANYRKLYNGRGIRLKYSVLPAAEFDIDADTIKFSDSRSLWK